MAGDPTMYLENSFLAPLLSEEGVTDISYNGTSLYFATNVKGREKSSSEVTKEEVGDFLRQIANFTERQFSYSYPILDVSFGKYRLNAVYSSLVRNRNAKTYSFSLRLVSEKCRLDDDPSFFGGDSRGILLALLQKGESMVIGGKTSSGKTELEKWLLANMPPSTRVIVIDNVEELDLMANPAIDLTTWLVNESIPSATFSSLIRNALRNNPDYILVAEARGAEMLDALISAMSGHPIITTIHAQDLSAMPERMARLAMLGSERLFKEELLDDIAHHLRYYVYLEKKTESDGSISRFIRDIAELKERTREMKSLYRRIEA
jgi:pilus assembly protein CpaF